ncbi:DUF6973 domain-containing protein [Runella sp.]|uniref:DUF6973 domain-containing protein n=1 Tax=Runella sp. TaxID=1960881 RepID=UPI003D0BB558
MKTYYYSNTMLRLVLFYFCCFTELTAFGRGKSFVISNPLGINPRVQALGFTYPAQAQLMYQAANEANTYTDQRFGVGSQSQDNNSANAFRHSLWNALSVKKIKDAGSSEATAVDIVQQFTSAYEYDDSGTALIKNAASAMDLHNNLVGRSFKNYTTINQLLDSLFLKAIEPKVITSTLNQILAGHSADVNTAWDLLENTDSSLLSVSKSLVRIDPCTVLLVLNHTITNTVKFEVSTVIQAQNILSPSARVTYDAQNYVLLNPGFKAEQGSIFTAYVDGCGNK